MKTEQNHKIKSVLATFAVILALMLALIVMRAFLHNNSVQNFQVIQSVTGSIEVRSDGGYYFRAFPKIWTFLVYTNLGSASGSTI